ncbi:hypothetical protein [Streptomyces triticisoli]|uniref:hypothetical protein n=1 Tax=Streptomyces triticisoli TaxID=2182797 RepID=UPI000DD5981A|nr:hypothetical protein [Streptomyces triticisoli]
MAQQSWPSPGHNNRAVTDLEYERMAARFSDDGVYGSPLDAAVVSAGAGLQVAIRANVEASVRGHAWTSGISGDTHPIAANASGQTRIDRVVLRLTRSTWQVRTAVKQGSPGGGAPALTQQTGDTGVFEIPLARATVLNGANAVSVAREELYVGARVRTCTSSTRNPAPVRGEMCFETDTGDVRIWTGSTWRVVSGDSGQVVVTASVSGWSVISDSVLEMRSGVVHLRAGTFKRAGGTLAAGVDTRLPILIPAAYRHRTRDQYVLAYTSGGGIGRFLIYASNTDRAGQAWMLEHPQINTGDNVIPQSGMSWVVD